MADGTALVDAWVHGERVGACDPPVRPVLRIEIEHDAMPAAAGTVEDEPLRTVRTADDHSMAGRQPVGDVGGRWCGEIGPPTAPVSDASYDVQFSPRNMS